MRNVTSPELGSLRNHSNTVLPCPVGTALSRLLSREVLFCFFVKCVSEESLRAGGGCAGCSIGSGAAPKVEAMGVASPTCSQCFSARGHLSKSKGCHMDTH